MFKYMYFDHKVSTVRDILYSLSSQAEKDMDYWWNMQNKEKYNVNQAYRSGLDTAISLLDEAFPEEVGEIVE